MSGSGTELLILNRCTDLELKLLDDAKNMFIQGNTLHLYKFNISHYDHFELPGRLPEDPYRALDAAREIVRNTAS